MYLAFTQHNMMPSAYFLATPSEKMLIRAFLRQEYEEKIKEAEEIERRAKR
jgi:hypothetical protein